LLLVLGFVRLDDEFDGVDEQLIRRIVEIELPVSSGQGCELQTLRYRAEKNVRLMRHHSPVRSNSEVATASADKILRPRVTHWTT
jgi:hypothetical protein